jgi:hypothetical protein
MHSRRYITNQISHHGHVPNSLSPLLPLEPRASFGSVDFTEPGKLERQWEPCKSGYLNWAVGRLLVKGKAMDKVENSTLEIGSGEDLRNALHAVDVAKGKLDTLVGQRITMNE